MLINIYISNDKLKVCEEEGEIFYNHCSKKKKVL